MYEPQYPDRWLMPHMPYTPLRCSAVPLASASHACMLTRRQLFAYSSYPELTYVC